MTDTLAKAQSDTADASKEAESGGATSKSVGARSKPGAAAAKEVTWVEEVTNVLDDDELQEETQDRSDGVIARLALRAPPPEAKNTAHGAVRKDNSQGDAAVAGSPAVKATASAITKVEGRASTVEPTVDQSADETVDKSADETVDKSADQTVDQSTEPTVGQTAEPEPTPAEEVAQAPDVPALSSLVALEFEQPDEYAPSSGGPGRVLRYLVPLAVVLLGVGYFAVGGSDSGTPSRHAANESLDDPAAALAVQATDSEVAPEFEIVPDPVSEPEPEPEPEADPESEPEPEIAPVSDPGAVTESAPELVDAPVLDPEGENDVDPQLDPEGEPEADPEPEVVAKPEIREPRVDTKKKSEPGPRDTTKAAPLRDRAAAKELNKAAMAAFVRGALPAAEKAFLKALRADPTYTVALRGLALVYERRGAKTKAAATFRRYLKREPRAKDAKAIRSRLKQLEK